MSRNELITEAEALALSLVELVEQERAAYRAVLMSDPFARPTFESAHRRIEAQQSAAQERFLVLVFRLSNAGLSRYAGNLHNSTIANCLVAIWQAHTALLREREGAK